MQIDTRKKTFRVAPITLSVMLLAASALAQEQPLHPSTGTPALASTGEVLALHISVSFAHLAPEWVTEQNVMDPIWEPLGYKGVNYYAYGGPATGHDFAARSDPNSSLYQAWFGAYVIADGKAAFGTGDENRGCQAFAKLAEYDQRSWLQAMGDLARVRIFTCKTKIEPIVGDDYLDLSFIRCRLSWFWGLLS